MGQDASVGRAEQQKPGSKRAKCKNRHRARVLEADVGAWQRRGSRLLFCPLGPAAGLGLCRPGVPARASGP